MHQALNKHGVDSFSFDVIASCPKDDISHLEEYYIKWYNALAPHGYNLISGDGASPITKARMSLASRRLTGTKPYTRRSTDADGLPKYIYLKRKNDKLIGFMVSVPGHKERVIASMRCTMDQKLQMAKDHVLNIQNGCDLGVICRMRRTAENDGLPTGMCISTRWKTARYIVRLCGFPRKSFLTQGEAQTYLTSITL